MNYCKADIGVLYQACGPIRWHRHILCGSPYLVNMHAQPHKSSACLLFTILQVEKSSDYLDRSFSISLCNSDHHLANISELYGCLFSASCFHPVTLDLKCYRRLGRCDNPPPPPQRGYASSRRCASIGRGIELGVWFIRIKMAPDEHLLELTHFFHPVS